MPRPRSILPRFLRILAVGLPALLALAGCDRNDRARPAPLGARGRLVESTGVYRPEPIGGPVTEHPWVAHVTTCDLDRDGLVDVLACESQQNTVLWLRQVSRGRFEEIVVGADMRAPVHVEPADMDGDGDLDLLVASMGFVLPNNDRIGSVIILENDGAQKFAPRIILENTARVTDLQAADLNGDGRLDLVVGQFGYDQGEVRWMERTGPWEFKSHLLLELSGAINVCVDDLTGDRHPDIVALISQQWEEIHLFEGDGRGGFKGRVVFGSTNEDYGSSGISLCDLNGDGRKDILYSNGDGFGPAATPGPRPWHGVQWLENNGGGFFRYHRIGDLPGAYSPIGVDVDRDGHTDVIAVSAYSDWDKKNPRVVSMMWFRNDGRLNFEPRILAYAPKDLITVAAGDLDGTGLPCLVTGGFYVFPPYSGLSRITLWRPAP